MAFENDAFGDDSEGFSLRYRTPWLNAGNLGGWQRVKGLILTGEFRSNCTVNIAVYQDYNDTAPIHIVQYPTAELNLTKGRLLEIRTDIGPVQQCESIAFEIYDTDQTGSQESFKLSGLTLEIAVKPTRAQTQKRA